MVMLYISGCACMHACMYGKAGAHAACKRTYKCMSMTPKFMRRRVCAFVDCAYLLEQSEVAGFHNPITTTVSARLQ